MKIKNIHLLGFLILFPILIFSQEAHPPINKGAEGMFYWSESQQKYVRGTDAMIDVRQYGGMFGASNLQVVNFLTGKTFIRKTSGKPNEYAKCEFVGMDAMSTNPFNFNPYPNARDFAGNPWDFPQNRLRVILRTNDNQTDTCFVYEVEFLQNGAAKLNYFQKGGVKDYSWYLFKVDPAKNSGVESYLGFTPNGFYKLDENFIYGLNFNGNSIEAKPNCIITFKTSNALNLSNFKLSEALEDNFVLALEFNSTISLQNLVGIKFKAQVTSRKAIGIGKSKVVKGDWTITDDRKNLIVSLEDGTKKSFRISKINSGYIQEITDVGSERVYSLSQVDKL